MVGAGPRECGGQRRRRDPDPDRSGPAAEVVVVMAWWISRAPSGRRGGGDWGQVGTGCGELDHR
jgi:hypothetical protein